ncbi:IS5/IS1182 family transposase, partial [Streptococcus dentapri]
REIGKSKMEDKVGLILACLNLKKLVKMMAGTPFYFGQFQLSYPFFILKIRDTKKDKPPKRSLSSV